MLKISVAAYADFLCYLTESDSRKVEEYAKEHNCSLETAAEQLQKEDEIDMFYDSEAMWIEDPTEIKIV